MSNVIAFPATNLRPALSAHDEVAEQLLATTRSLLTKLAEARADEAAPAESAKIIDLAAYRIARKAKAQRQRLAQMPEQAEWAIGEEHGGAAVTASHRATWNALDQVVTEERPARHDAEIIDLAAWRARTTA